MKKTINILVVSAIVLLTQNAGMAQSVERKQNPDKIENSKTTDIKKGDKVYTVKQRNPGIIGEVKTEKAAKKVVQHKEKTNLASAARLGDVDENGKLIKTKKLDDLTKKSQDSPWELNEYEQGLVDIYKKEQQGGNKDEK